MPLSSSPGSSGDESSIIMGRNSNLGRGAFPRRVELDVAAIMNLEQKNSLQVLINNITDDMQKDLCTIFDNLGTDRDPSDEGLKPPKAIFNLIPNPRSPKYRHLYSSKDNGTDETQDAKIVSPEPIMPPAPTLPPAPVMPPAFTLSPSQPLWTIPKSAEEASLMSGKTENEILSDSLSELKKDLLVYFGKWKANVQKRLSDMTIKGNGTGGVPAGQGQQQGPGTARPKNKPNQGRAAIKQGGTDPATLASNDAMARHYPATLSSLGNLPKEKRAMILHCIMLLLLGLEHYSSYSRRLLLHLATALQVPAHVLAQDEARVAGGLSQIVKDITSDEIIQKRAEEGKSSRRNKAGLTTSTATGSTVSLAPPLFAAGIGTVFGGALGLGPATTAALLGSMADSTVTVGSLFGLYGGRPGGKTMESFLKDIPDFGMLPVHGSMKPNPVDPKDLPPENRRMRVTICVNGWLTQESENVTAPWQFLGSQNEVYALRHEVEVMDKVGSSLDTVMKSAAWSLAKKEIASRTGNEHPSVPSDQQLNGFPVFASLNQALWPMGLLKISKLVENPWCVGMVRAEKTGLILADALMNKLQGERGVTLIGYSLGARVIYSCLMYLAEKRAFGLVENVVMMGAPCPTEMRAWGAMRSAVTGRLVNVYSKNDYMLGFLYRSSSWHYGVAGLQKVQGVPGVENLNESGIIHSHDHYRYLLGGILKKLSWEDISYAQIAKDEEMLAQLVAQQEKLGGERDQAAQADATDPDKQTQKAQESSKHKENRKGVGRKGGRKQNK
ncbi:hypothetical protein DL767_005669 [Monosporascus sp. MG133]|nr:hypothetical protein DL767_005669 [Monosporascus sp. MG133]